jgi:hypothetical protein
MIPLILGMVDFVFTVLNITGDWMLSDLYCGVDDTDHSNPPDLRVFHARFSVQFRHCSLNAYSEPVDVIKKTRGFLYKLLLTRRRAHKLKVLNFYFTEDFLVDVETMLIRREFSFQYFISI